MTDITNAQWKAQIKDDAKAVILDVRTPEEVEEGYIPESIQMDIYQAAEFMEAVNALDPAKNYYVYCRSGGRSAQACAVLESVGIANTYNLIGGFSEWDGEVSQ